MPCGIKSILGWRAVDLRSGWPSDRRTAVPLLRGGGREQLRADAGLPATACLSRRPRDGRGRNLRPGMVRSGGHCRYRLPAPDTQLDGCARRWSVFRFRRDACRGLCIAYADTHCGGQSGRSPDADGLCDSGHGDLFGALDPLRGWVLARALPLAGGDASLSVIMHWPAWILPLGVCFVCLAVILSLGNWRDHKGTISAGVLIGLLIVIGWWVTGVLGADDFDPRPPASLAMAAPLARSAAG